ncbi:hypothetical protein [Rhizobium paknamense]|uniref:Uncharacterized protein n=1 Tax=Rhizobium paknamense TaxID=1206817 RepID=A0ABU0IAJ1_9HYPH|nr:hypothetical protein [Rhizobium paknamense]MDQ0455248.1 hypothetical protein [Rhizobium paknamense]
MPDPIIGSVQTSAAVQPASPPRATVDETEMEGLSFLERETYRLARDAERSNNVEDKMVLNVVHPPALVLLALLNGDRSESESDLQRAKEAYEEIAASAVPDPAPAEPAASAAKTSGEPAASPSSASGSAKP